jgi:NTE family protein
MPERDTVGLVIAGAGARGAYEAGALAELLPRLEDDGRRPSVLVGTSAGAINASLLAAKLHLGARTATQELVGFWGSLHKPELLGPLAITAVPALLGYAGRIAYLGTGSGSIASFGRFPQVLDAAVGDWGQISSNVEAGELRAVGVVATPATSGGSVVFADAGGHVALPPPDDKKGIRYVAAQVERDHVVASSSIPIFFPPTRVRRPAGAEGWYWDGGTRLNTPIRPVLSIGVDSLVIVGTDPPRHLSAREGQDMREPDFDDGALHVLQATLNDSVIEDLHSLVRVNEILTAAGERQLGRRRLYEYMFAGPDEHGALGRVAAEVLRREYGGPLRALSDFAVLDRLLGRQGSQQAELQSYLLFDTDFLQRLIDLGRKAGQDAWKRGWLTDRLP